MNLENSTIPNLETMNSVHEGQAKNHGRSCITDVILTLSIKACTFKRFLLHKWKLSYEHTAGKSVFGIYDGMFCENSERLKDL